MLAYALSIVRFDLVKQSYHGSFSETNTRERFDADLKTNAANGDYRPIIRGYAVSTRAPKP